MVLKLSSPDNDTTRELVTSDDKIMLSVDDAACNVKSLTDDLTVFDLMLIFPISTSVLLILVDRVIPEISNKYAGEDVPIPTLKF